MSVYVDFVQVKDYNSDERRAAALLIAVTSLSLSQIARIADDVLANLSSSRELNSSVQFYFVLNVDDQYAVKANKNDLKRSYSNATRRLNRLVSREYKREQSKAYTVTAMLNAKAFTNRAIQFEQLSEDDQATVTQALEYARQYERTANTDRVTAEQAQFHSLCKQADMKL